MAAQESQVVQSREVRFNFIAEEDIPLEWTCSFCDSGQIEFPRRDVKFVTDNSIIVHGDCAIAMKNLKAVFGPNRNRVGEICKVPRLPVEGGDVSYQPVSKSTCNRMNRKKCVLIIFSKDSEITQLVGYKIKSLFKSTNFPPADKTKEEIRAFLIDALA